MSCVCVRNLPHPQEIDNIDYATYMTNEALHQSTLKETIAQTMTGVSAEDLHDFEVESTRDDSNEDDSNDDDSNDEDSNEDDSNDDSEEAPSEEHSVRRRRLQSSITLDYVVEVRDASLSFSGLSSELQQAVESGDFDMMLSTNAASAGATALLGASSSMVSTQQSGGDGGSSSSSGSSGGSSSSISTGIIVGVVVAALVGVALLAMLGCCVSRKSCRTMPAGGQLRSEQSPLTAVVIDAPQNKKDVADGCIECGGGSGGTVVAEPVPVGAPSAPIAHRTTPATATAVAATACHPPQPPVAPAAVYFESSDNTLY